jgi:2-polyprenyl-3-methyl-5-hydroxy-6-metoxy-1,4-benzoquinol methylase
MELDLMQQYVSTSMRPCVVCGGKKFDIFAKKAYLTANKCKKCGMISVNPYFTDAGVQVLYSEYLSERLLNVELENKRNEMYDIDRDWILNYIQSGSLLDIGSSAGYFLSRFDQNKFDRYGVEFSSECKDKARQLFNIPVRIGNIVDMSFDIKYDLITLRGVIEHFIDPDAVIDKISKIINIGGYLYITATPNGESFAFNVYREKWKLFSIDHVHFFSVNQLNAMIKKYGFSLVSYHYPYENTPYADIDKDFNKIKKDIALIESGHGDMVDSSVPFPGSMITAVWRFDGLVND